MAALTRPSDVDPFYETIQNAGDLDGDGRADVLVVEFPSPSFALPYPALDYPPARLVARSGDDGHVLWSVPTNNYPDHLYLYFTVPGTPAPVEGYTHPLVVTLDITSPGGVRANVVRQTISVLDGRNGTTLWSRDLAGVLPGDVGGEYPEGDGAIVSGIAPIADPTPGHGDDLLVSVSSIAGVYLNVTGLVLDGETGGALGTAAAISAAPGYSPPWVVPATEPGSTRPALLTFSILGLLTTASLQPIPPGAPFWTLMLPGMPAVGTMPEAAPPVALGLDSYLFHRVDVQGRSELIDVVRSGTVAWSSAEQGYLDPAGQVDGDGIGDVKLLFASPEGMSQRVLNGATGAELWHVVMPYPAPPPGGSSYTFTCTCGSDLNNDGALDTLISYVVSDDRGQTTDRRTIAFEGKDGSVLWTTPRIAGYADYPFPIGADLTGDGSNDVVGFLAVGGPPGEMELGVDLHNGSDFAPEWSATVPKPIRSGQYQFRVDTHPVGRGLATSLDEYSFERQPDGTFAWRYYPSVHLFEDGIARWSA